MSRFTHDRAAQMPLTRSYFRDRFLTTSERILKDETSAIKQLPRRLIKRITQTRGMFSKG
ncbi:LOW QUALITY PROTEIN: hypothetical protein MKX08_004806 [Trichoderma sp. CBMAI-0020]|nr:LOW QUALITY PROTEIN: hypothetical protein MKX08_004806 [Trichoderma sp. CBMAI-0020]